MTSYAKDIYTLFTDKQVSGACPSSLTSAVLGDVKARSSGSSIEFVELAARSCRRRRLTAMVLGRKRRSIYLKRG